MERQQRHTGETTHGYPTDYFEHFSEVPAAIDVHNYRQYMKECGISVHEVLLQVDGELAETSTIEKGVKTTIKGDNGRTIISTVTSAINWVCPGTTLNEMEGYPSKFNVLNGPVSQQWERARLLAQKLGVNLIVTDKKTNVSEVIKPKPGLRGIREAAELIFG
ncbi:hypothetical protein HGA88_03880 [Candidatus Roizmanbacteria bacterium]|nr:hypothetical protein [Candidatus Roizmanbacteria bacterium]